MLATARPSCVVCKRAHFTLSYRAALTRLHVYMRASLVLGLLGFRKGDVGRQRSPHLNHLRLYMYTHVQWRNEVKNWG